MPKYRVNLFVQFEPDEPRYGCHYTLKVDAKSETSAPDAASAEALTLFKAHHPEHRGPLTMRVTQRPMLMKAIKQEKS